MSYVFHRDMTSMPAVAVRGEGPYVIDADGRRYLDFSSQLVFTNLGHQHPRIVAAIKQQADRLCTLAPGHASDVRGEAARLIVEVAPEAAPPVCRIMDFGKFKYQQSRRAKDARKKQTVIQVKEVKMGPKTDEHDFQFKARHVRRFIEDGNKAKVTIRFRGREMVHTELGRRLLDRMTQDLLDIATIESHARLEGRNMVMILTPKQR